jgi:hypothetical protein
VIAVMEVCEECGSEDIQFLEDRDDSVGYHAEEWRCMECGASCEYFEPAPVQAAAEEAA